jgi:hypothetical protein
LPLETSDDSVDGNGNDGGGCADRLPTFPLVFWTEIRNLMIAIREEVSTPHQHPAPDFDKVAKIMIDRLDGPRHNVLLGMGNDCVVSLDLKRSTATKFSGSSEDTLGVVYATGSPSRYGISSKTAQGFSAFLTFDMETLPHVYRFARELPLSLFSGI